MKNILGRIFSLDECNEIINSLDNIKWERYTHELKNEVTLETFKSDYYLTDFNHSDLVNTKFKNLINSKFSFKVNDVNIFLLKYLPNQSFGRHTDRNENSEHHKDYIYNVNVVLNDNFEGGEFYLNDKKFEGNTPGIAYTYNSYEFHEVKPIISGIRYSMLCYIRERDFVNKTNKSLL